VSDEDSGGKGGSSGKVRRRSRVVQTSLQKRPADEIPGAVLETSTEHEVTRRLRSIDDAQRRARMRGREYLLD